MTEKNTLVVPIRLEALAVNRNFKGKPVRRWCMDYSKLLIQKNPEPEPFARESETPYFDDSDHWGVYLHWLVPEALRKGEQKDRFEKKGDQKDESEAEFPALPNRWLIARQYEKDNSNDHPAIKYWLIKSDELDAGNDGGSPFAYIKKIKKTGNKKKAAGKRGRKSLQITRLGKSYEIENLEALQKMEEMQPTPAVETADPPTLKDRRVISPPSLNALGFGDVNFLAYQPSVNDVFSFHDDLKDVRDGDELSFSGKLHYLVAGWYSDPKDDVLQRGKKPNENIVKGVPEILDDLNWRIADMNSDTNADSAEIDRINKLERTIYTGRQYQIDWSTATHIMDSLDDEGLEVAFGNNALDAMQALLEKTDYGKRVGQRVDRGTLQFLKPFVYGQLPLFNEPGGFVRFNQEIRKTWFKAISGGVCWKVEYQASSDEQSGAATGVLPGAGIVPQESRDPVDIPEAAKRLLEELNVQQEALEKNERELIELQKLFYDAWWQLNAGQDDAESNQSDSTPLTGEFAKLSKSKLAKHIRKKSESLLKTAETIEELKARLTRKLPPGYQIYDTARQPFFKPLDPTILIAGLKSHNPAETDGPLECRELVALQSDPAENVPPTGTNPGDILSILMTGFINRQGQESFQWEQPWNPFFLEWEVEWFALPFCQDRKRFWKFTVSDYEIQTNVSQDAVEKRTHRQILKGRTFLALQNNQLLELQTNNLKAMLLEEERKGRRRQEEKAPEGNNKSDSPLKHFVEFVNELARERLLSQSLLEFNNQLELRQAQLSILPREPELVKLVGDQYRSQPLAPASTSAASQGIRQGHFKIKKLHVYDGFGQCLELVGPAGLKKEEAFSPVKDNNLAPDETQTHSHSLLELKPRIMDYVRLRFDFIDAENEKRTLDVHRDVNPIVGWVLYNHLDKSLVLFNDMGNYAGELRVVHGKVEKINLDSNLKKRFSAVVEKFPTNAQLFNLFLNVIDETLWTIEPNAGLQEQHLAVWVGRPLALVRTRLKFEVFGAEKSESRYFKRLADDIQLPAYKNPVSLKQKAQTFQEFEFNVRLGSRGIRQDGLIGYFLDRAFYTVHDLKVIPPQYAHRIKPINADNLIRLKFSNDPNEQSAGAQHLTLLVDPAAAVYAQTGILPYTSLRLPERFVNKAMETIQVSFRYHCLLTTKQQADDPEAPQRLRMPLPALRKGNWEWIENGNLKFYIQGLPAAGKISNEPAVLRDGRLTLSESFNRTKEE